MTKTRTPEPRAEFDVALSFAGDDRQYVEEVAHCLRDMGIKVFYDRYEKVTLWGKDLYTHLQEVYSQCSRYVVMFISKDYKRRLWTNHERKSAQARAFMENRDFILPARFDLTEIPGVLQTTGYIDLRTTIASGLADLIRQKLGMICRQEYFPPKPDLLFKKTGARTKVAKRIAEGLARNYFEMAKLMTKEERTLIAEACRLTCPCGPPKDVHLRLDYLSRVVGRSEREILSMGARLDCLSIKVSTEQKRDGKARFPVVTFRFMPLLPDLQEESGSHVMYAIHECVFDRLCPGCGREAVARLDFSQLSSRTCFDDRTHRPNNRPNHTVAPRGRGPTSG